MDGMELLQKIFENNEDVQIIMISGHGNIETAVEAIKKGAYDFIQKPIERVYFVAALHRAIQTHQLQHQVQEQQKLLASYTKTLQRFARQRAEVAPTTEEREAVHAGSPFPTPRWLIS